MNKAELAEINKIYRDNIHLLGPGMTWLVQYSKNKPKEKPTHNGLLAQARAAMDYYEANGTFTHRG